MEMYSTGEAAKRLRVTRDSLLFAIRSSGAPEASQWFGGRRFFSGDDIKILEKWFKNRTKRRSNAAKNVSEWKRDAGEA